MFSKKIIFFIVISFLVSIRVNISQEDSLLKKLNELEIPLDSTEDSLEDLYSISVSFQSFYDDLSPEGEWIQISKDEIKEDLQDGEGQGFASDITKDDEPVLYVWHPTGMKDGWHPYTNGRWVFTTQGWMWASNYSWGWMTCHYGRWWNSKYFGWVWVPGHVWAPAWVRWKISEGYIGWCPLTPYAKWNINEGVTISNYKYVNRDIDWVFVGKNNFIEEINKANTINHEKNSEYVKNSRDIINLKFENSRINNFGPDIKDIESATNKTLLPKEIKLSGVKSKDLIGDNEVTVYRQQFKKLAIDPVTGKPVQTDKPKTFKIASKIKKHVIRRMIRRRNRRIRK